jgi:hypothetical protein
MEGWFVTPNDDSQSLSLEDIPDDLVIETRISQPVPFGEESLEFHAARLLLLLKFAGGRTERIVGRTKIAKMDFFVRYPTYLVKAANLQGIQTNLQPGARPESPMIRYKYGPWDTKYYDVFALLVAKGLISIHPTDKGDEFALTDRGQFAIEELQGPEFEEIVERCRLVYRLFGGKSGTAMKKFIYDNFPEIVARPMGWEIEQ